MLRDPVELAYVVLVICLVLGFALGESGRNPIRQAVSAVQLRPDVSVRSAATVPPGRPTRREQASWHGSLPWPDAPVPSAHSAQATWPPIAPPAESEPSEPSHHASEDPAPPSVALQISDVSVNSVAGPREASVSWHTNLPTWTRGARGASTTPTIWTEQDGPSYEHHTVFTGLDFSMQYTMWLQAVDEWGRSATTTLQLTMPAPGQRPMATAAGSAILLDGQPFFPLMVWAPCSDRVPGALAAGIDVFMGTDCNQRQVLAAVSGRAFAIVNSESDDTQEAPIIGWHYPDEWDTFLPSDVTVGDLRRLAPEPPTGLLSFLTLTNHFYSGAAPLPQGRGMYPALTSIADVVGFDLYPLQNWCRTDRFGAVFDSQRELEALTGGKPTFQWIEARTMDCPATDDLVPTADTVRAETWLAIGGGADAIGYFPDDWSPTVRTEIRRTNDQIKDLSAALVAAPADASSDVPAVKVAARSLNGALYVIAVNTTRAPADASITVSGLGGQTLRALGEQRTITSVDDTFRETFGPLEVHLYVVPPSGWADEGSAAVSTVDTPSPADVDATGPASAGRPAPGNRAPQAKTARQRPAVQVTRRAGPVDRVGFASPAHDTPPQESPVPSLPSSTAPPEEQGPLVEPGTSWTAVPPDAPFSAPQSKGG